MIVCHIEILFIFDTAEFSQRENFVKAIGVTDLVISFGWSLSTHEDQSSFSKNNNNNKKKPSLIYTAQGSPFRRKKLSVINRSPEQQRTHTKHINITLIQVII